MIELSSAALKRRLREREKELDFLYAAAELLARSELSEEELFAALEELLPLAMQCPGKVRVRGGFSAAEPLPRYRFTAGSGGRTVHLGVDVLPGGRPLVKRERRLVQSTAVLLDTALRGIQFRTLLGKTNRALRRKNAALHELLAHLRREKRDTRDFLLERLRGTASSLLESLDSLPRERRASELPALLAQALEAPANETAAGNEAAATGLSPREAELCSYIRAGFSTKDIAARLSISESTVERHRCTIRRKLGLTNRPVNLTSYLRTM